MCIGGALKRDLNGCALLTGEPAEVNGKNGVHAVRPHSNKCNTAAVDPMRMAYCNRGISANPFGVDLLRRAAGRLKKTVPCAILTWVTMLSLLGLLSTHLRAQTVDVNETQTGAANRSLMEERIKKLEAEVAELKTTVNHLRATSASMGSAESVQAPSQNVTPATQQQAKQSANNKTVDFLHDTTVNVLLDTYYEYNFNHPVGRANLLRAYDVLSNNISLNQAAVIFEHTPDPADGRRWGARIDLQFGQATDTLQGNPANEPRPDIYRNVFQAYGTYVLPVGNGVTVDLGKWASSLGIEGNYTKDQINYSRSYYFNFLPFYHTGIRANYKLNDKLALNYWAVNGTNQAEDTNAFKDELVGFVATPSKTLTWTTNYYYGQDHPDRADATNCGTAPIQPGLCFAPIRPAPDGRTHIFDSYVSWQPSSKWTLALEGDYVIQRLWRHATPGHSSAPIHVTGGAIYARYQVTPRVALAGRAEYLSDRGGLFSGATQALKETTATFDYKLTDNLLMRYEWRRDFSNQPFFLTDIATVSSKEQNTAAVGLVWWWGRKEGSW